MHADKEPEPLNLGVPVVNFPRANAILARAQALLWVRDWGDFNLVPRAMSVRELGWHWGDFGVLVYGFDFQTTGW